MSRELLLLLCVDLEGINTIQITFSALPHLWVFLSAQQASLVLALLTRSLGNISLLAHLHAAVDARVAKVEDLLHAAVVAPG